MLPFLLLFLVDPVTDPAAPPPARHATGFATIEAVDLYQDVCYLAAPELEGRDTPSVGLERAAEHIAAAFAAAGLEDVPGQTESYRWTYVQERAYPGRPLALPVQERCGLSFSLEEGGDAVELEFGTHFVPVDGCTGEARGEPVFLGFGIDSEKNPYNDLKGRGLKGKIAVILEGEPRHKRLFEGEEVTREAGLYRKLEVLEERGVAGVLVVRRPPPAPPSRKKSGIDPGPGPLSFRHSWAFFKDHAPPWLTEVSIPVLEITPEAASRILPCDVLDEAAEIERRGKPRRVDAPGREVFLSAATRPGSANVDNVVGLLRGTELPDEYVVIGAHYDHIGVDPRGRIGTGADDNATGTAAVMEMMEAFATERPRRSILAVLFAGEEDGLLGSQAFCARPPVPVEDMVAMVNMDMLGRGERDEILLLGLDQNPELEDVVDRAKKLARTRIKKVHTNRGRELFQRSDHYSFHQVGVPSLFFYEGWPETDNEDYHTFEDTIEKLDMEKVTRSVRLIYNVVWLLANDDSRPPRPETSGR